MNPRAVVIGCGKIGSLWDETHRTDAVLTHAGAWWRLGLLTGCAEPEFKRWDAILRRWPGVLIYADYRELLEKTRPDLVSIATPSEIRLPVIEAALAAGVRAILIEKPLATTLNEARAIIQAAHDFGAVVAVNYLRRYDPQMMRIAAEIKKGCLGIIQQAIGHYGKGIRENGSHLIDLIHWWIGPVHQAQVLRRGADDRSDADPTLDVLLEIERDQDVVPVYLTGIDYRHYALFELDIIGHTGRLLLSDRGMYLQRWEAAPDRLFPGYRVLNLVEEIQPDISHGLLHAATDLLSVWRGVRNAPCATLADGYAVLEALSIIFKSKSLDSDAVSQNNTSS